MNQDILVQDQLIQLLGKECYTEDGTLNRPYVAKLIFNNEQLKQDLENIVHPKVAQAFNQWAEAQNSPFVFVESAILYESGFDAHVDKVIVVDADMEVRIQRVMQRDLCTREQAEQRIKAQMDSAEKQKRAHYIIYNNPTEEINSQLFKLVKSLYKD
jgi:dephospho-CoA kinase